MADTINIGNYEVSSFKVGSDDCNVYLGDTLLYSGGTPPTPSSPKWIATYSDSSVTSAECDASSAITSGEIDGTDLVSVEIGDCVTSIGNSAFRQCTSLTSATIGSGVTSIGLMAFFSCSNLTSVTVNATTPPTLDFIVFDETNDCPIYVPCQSLEAYKTAWSDYESRISCPPFDGKWLATYSDSHTESADCDSSSAITQSDINLTDLETVEIGDCVTSIEFQSFFMCSSLISIDIPDSVTSIGDMAFTNCSSLTSIEIPDSVTSIGQGAFESCRSLTSVTIGSGITSIGNNAFYSCSELTSVTINATAPPTLGMSSFDIIYDYPIYVPSQSVSAYQSAWRDYASRIQAIQTWHQIASGDSISENASAIRVSTGVTGLNSGQNATFGNISSNTYSILWENGAWYNWRVMTNGSFTPDSKTLLTESNGYYTITFDSAYPFLGCDADVYGQGGVMYATFPFEILV